MEVSNFTDKEKKKEKEREKEGNEHEEEQKQNSVGVGVSSVVSSLLSDHDSAAQLTLASQTNLSSSLHRLTRELDRLLEDAPLPFAAHYGAKISSVRKRVLSLNSLLKSIQQRLDNVDRMLSLRD